MGENKEIIVEDIKPDGVLKAEGREREHEKERKDGWRVEEAGDKRGQIMDWEERKEKSENRGEQTNAAATPGGTLDCCCSVPPMHRHMWQIAVD